MGACFSCKRQNSPPTPSSLAAASPKKKQASDVATHHHVDGRECVIACPPHDILQQLNDHDSVVSISIGTTEDASTSIPSSEVSPISAQSTQEASISVVEPSTESQETSKLINAVRHSSSSASDSGNMNGEESQSGGDPQLNADAVYVSSLPTEDDKETVIHIARHSSGSASVTGYCQMEGDSQIEARPSIMLEKCGSKQEFLHSAVCGAATEDDETTLLHLHTPPTSDHHLLPAAHEEKVLSSSAEEAEFHDPFPVEEDPMKDDDHHADEAELHVRHAEDQFVIGRAVVPYVDAAQKMHMDEEGAAAVERRRPSLKRSRTCEDSSAVSESLSKRLFRHKSLRVAMSSTTDAEGSADHCARHCASDFRGGDTSEHAGQYCRTANSSTPPPAFTEADQDSYHHSYTNVSASAGIDAPAAETASTSCLITAGTDSNQRRLLGLDMGILQSECTDLPLPKFQDCSSECAKSDVGGLGQTLAMESSSMLASKFFELKKQYLSSCSAESSRALGRLRNLSCDFQMLAPESACAAEREEGSINLSTYAHSRATSMDSVEQQEAARVCNSSSFRREQRFFSMRSMSSLDEDDYAAGRMTSGTEEDSETFEFCVSFRSAYSGGDAKRGEVPILTRKAKKRKKKNRQVQQKMWKKPAWNWKERGGGKTENGMKTKMGRPSPAPKGNVGADMNVEAMLCAAGSSGRVLSSHSQQQQQQRINAKRHAQSSWDAGDEMQNRALWSILRCDTSRSFVASSTSEAATSDHESCSLLDVRAMSASTTTTTPCTTPLLSANSSPRRIKQICPLVLTPQEIAEIWVSHHLKPIDFCSC